MLINLRHKLAVRLWRLKFFASYMLAVACHRGTASTLLFFTEQAFAHPWVTRVTLEFSPFTPTRYDKFEIDAPVMLSVWHKETRALVMSGHFLGKCWYIKQLQGARGVNVPIDLDWAPRFVRACQAFALKEEFNQVRLARARGLFQYRNPRVRVRKDETLEDARARVRKKMLVHYDQTAQQLGFVPEGRWAVWRPKSHYGSRKCAEQQRIQRNSPTIEGNHNPFHHFPTAQSLASITPLHRARLLRR